MKKRTARKAIQMGRQASFNWQLRDDSSNGGEETLVNIANPSRQRAWLTLLVCTLAVLVIGYWGGQWLIGRAEENLGIVEAEITDAVILANEVRPPNLPALGADIASEWGDNVTLVELYFDTALVEVQISEPSEAWHEAPYRVARVLRQDSHGWQLIEPAHVFWSNRRTLETRYFQLTYSQRDASAVDKVAPELDAIYLRLRKDLALPAPAPRERVEIDIALVEGSAIRVTDLSYRGNTLIIPPPDLVPRPLDISNTETLRQAITYSLAVKLFSEAQELSPVPCAWNAVAEGVALWLRWEGHTLPSRRRWLYESMVNEWSNPSSLPRLDDLLSFPLSCSPPPSVLEAEILNSGRAMPRQELASTLIEYLVANYGRQVAPNLLRDLGQFSDWDDFAEQTVGLSAEELQTGWQEYLVQRSH
jgi:hypothetical protein